VTTHGGAVGDTTSVQETLPAAGEAVAEQIAEPTADGQFKVNARGVEEIVADKGYHSGDVLVSARESEVRSTSLNRIAGGGSGRANTPSRRPSTPTGNGSVAIAVSSC
jgi:hypothetical protein